MKTPTILLLTLSVAAISSCAPTQKNTTNKGVPAPVVAELSEIPVAKPDPQGRKDMVISPYSPYNIIDCKGFKRGDVAGDPSTAQKDANGKIIANTSKYFVIP